MTQQTSSIISGTNAYQWSSRSIALILAWVALGVIAAAVNFARPSGHTPSPTVADYVFWAIFIAWIVLMLVTALVTIKFRSVQKAELQRGYSTLPFQNAAVDVYDTPTGLIVRTADQPPLVSKADLTQARAKPLRERHENSK